MEQPKVDLNPQQVQMAANAGITLLNTPGAVNVPSPMAVSGIVRTLYQMLLAISNGEVMLVNIPVKLGDAPEPNKEVAAAVAGAVKNNGKGEDSSIAPVESEGIPPAANKAEAARKAEK
jgi:hypothetical protein